MARFLKCVLRPFGLSALLFVLSFRALAISFTVSGKIGDDKDRLELIIEVNGLVESEFPKGDPGLQRQALGIRLPDGGENLILNGLADTATERLSDFYWELDNVTESASGETYSLNYQLTVFNNTELSATQTIADLMELNNKTVRVLPFFQKNGGSFVEASESFTVSLDFSVPDAIPEGIVVTALHKGLRVSWKGNVPVPYVVSDDADASKEKIPSKVLVMLVPVGENSLDLSASKADTQSGNHEESSCRYTFTETPSDCINCDDHQVFLEAEQAIDIIRTQQVSNKIEAPSVTFNNLSLAERYKIILQYEKGIQRSLCLNGSPIETLTMTEANGEAEGVLGDPRCFIVSASYGDGPGSVVHTFRWFRDTFLMKWTKGREFIRWYYEKSPPFARIIRENPAIKMLVSTLLIPPVIFIKTLHFFYYHSVISVVFVIVLMLIFLGYGLNFYQKLF